MTVSTRNVLVFAGAGASKAVNKDKFPTTVEFFQALPTRISENSLFSFCIEYIQRFEKSDIIDIEQVLWTLKELGDFYRSVVTPNSVVGFAINSGLNRKIFPSSNDGHIMNLAASMQELIGQLVSDINAIVYSLYAYEPSETELEDNWIYTSAREA